MKSFILSGILSILLTGFFIALFNPTSFAFLKSLGDNAFIALAVTFFAGYVLSLAWGIMNVKKKQRALNVMGIIFSLCGLSVYLVGYMMNHGN